MAEEAPKGEMLRSRNMLGFGQEESGREQTQDSMSPQEHLCQALLTHGESHREETGAFRF